MRVVCVPVCAVVAALAACALLQLLLRDPVHAFPPTSTFELSSGEGVPMPFQIADSWHAMLMGTVDVSAVGTFLADVGLHPITPHDASRCVASIGAVEYIDSSAGTYMEYYVMLLAAERNLGVSPITSYAAIMLGTNRWAKPFASAMGLPDVTGVVWRMVVDSQKSLLAGREIWGYPKDLAEFRVTDKDDTRSVEVGCSDKSGTFHSFVHARYSTLGEMRSERDPSAREGSWRIGWPLRVPLALDGRTTTGTRIRHTSGVTAAVCRDALFVPVCNDNDVHAAGVDEEGSPPLDQDAAASPECVAVARELAHDVRSLAFEPVASAYYDHMRAVLFSPLP